MHSARSIEVQPDRPGMDRRRFLLTSLASVLAAAVAGEAQQTAKVARIGVLHPGAPATSKHFAAAFDQGLREHGYRQGQNIVVERRFAEAKAERMSDIAAELVRLAVFRQGLSEAGYVEGQNLVIEYRWAEGHYDRLPALAADLVGRKVDLIMANSPPSALAAKSATSTIPIVFRSGADPVGDGLVASLARPGGNLTGVSFIADELTAKRLELLSELVPRVGVIALLMNPNSATAERVIRDVQEAARTKGLRLHVLKVSSESEIDTAFASLVQLHAGALVVGADPFLSSRREQLVALASRHAVPSIYAWREFAASGGLISYGSSLTSAFRLLGTYAGKVLKGTKPADLPVQQSTTFELVINLKTAKALGLTIPSSLLVRADQVIE
jgi:putative tryptophan/tyrosine transport system substrate-binding protein